MRRLPWELAPLFRQWLELHYPQRADRVMARVQDMRGGKDYDSSFASRMKGQGLWADLLKQRFEKTCTRLGLNRQRVELDYSAFRPASRVTGQGMLFWVIVRRLGAWRPTDACSNHFRVRSGWANSSM